MDRITFGYWKRNKQHISPKKAIWCNHNSYIYGENMNIKAFAFGYYDENGNEQYVKTENNNLINAYFKFIQIICNKSKNIFDNFRSEESSEKYRIYSQSEKELLKDRMGNLRIDNDNCKIEINGENYFVANNLKIGEYIDNIAEKLPEDELENYFMVLNDDNNLEDDMAVLYLKRFTKQDITKSYSPSTDATKDFFGVDLNMTQDYVDINVSYYGTENYPSGITIHKGYQGEKDWRICGDKFKPLYDFRNPEEGDLSVWRRSGRNGNYKFSIQVIKQNESEYNDYIKFFSDKDNNLLLSVQKDKSDLLNDFSNSDYVNNSKQIIYYGVPGSGKSHVIEEEIKNVDKDQKMRVVFHPEYTNADFVGQILPIEDNGVDYRFKAGPFTRILKRAFQNPTKKYYLIIEEINRGNAAAIFGDLFQLLDREKNGFSSYPIENIDINSFIRSENNLHNDKIVPSTVKVGNINFTENTEIVLPPNLAIYATMNTSDQNVFTLDNAFQRRWTMELVENKFNTDNSDELAQANSKLEGFDITWKDFQKKINIEISKQAVESGLSSMEDKRLGCWFIKPDLTEGTEKFISKKLFSEKVLKYLWDDAFKFVRTEIFENEYQTLEDLSNAYQNNTNIFRDKSFLSSIPVENA